MIKTICAFSFAVVLLSGCNLATQTNDATLNKPNQTKDTTMDTTQNGKDNETIKSAKSAVIKTNKGDMTVEFYADVSPKTVANFVKLSEEGFYDNVKFHRIINDFMIQSGDPLSKDDSQKHLWGTGGPGYTFEDEFNDHKLVRGSLAMANRGPNTNGSQFFIVTTESTPWLDGLHTNFGMLTDGLDVLEIIEKIETGPGQSTIPLDDIVIEEIVITY